MESQSVLSVTLREAEQLQAQGRLEEAGGILECVVQQFPECGEAWFGLGGLSMRIGDNQSAVTFFEQACAVGLEDVACLANLGEAYRRLGERELATETLRKTCEIAPCFADAHLNMAAALADDGQFGDALPYAEKACALNAFSIEAWRTKAEIHRSLAHLKEAEEAFFKVLELAPGHQEAMLGLAETQRLRGDYVAAITTFETLLAFDPQNLRALFGLGVIAVEQRNYCSAKAIYRQAVTVAPDSPEALLGLGVAFLKSEDFEAAEVQLRRALALNVNNFDVRLQLSEALFGLDRYEESLAGYEAVLQADPRSISAWVGVGNIYLHRQQLDEAITHYRKALLLVPEGYQVYANLALAYFDQGKFAQAEKYGQRAVILGSVEEEANLAAQNLAQIQLRRGDLVAGWSNYERRRSRQARTNFSMPVWKGEPLAGKCIFLWQDQGVGDVVFFATLFQEFIEEAERVILECDSKLIPLIRRSFPSAVVIPRKPTEKHPLILSGVDYHCAQGSLPQYRRASFADFPSPPAAILIVDPLRKKYWRDRLAAMGDGIKVGICWRSMSSQGRRDLSYSELSDWTAVFELPGVQLINLQYDRCETELADAEALFGRRIENFREVDMFDDLDEVTALISQLDLVISASTSVSMLAAGVGTPTFLATTFFDWSCLGRKRDLWFRRLYRYPRRWNESWASVFAKIAEGIRKKFKLPAA